MSGPGVLVCQESKLLTPTVPFFLLEVKGLNTFHINTSMFPRAMGKVVYHKALTRESGSEKGVDLQKSVWNKAVSRAVTFTQNRWLELPSPLTLRGH